MNWNSSSANHGLASWTKIYEVCPSCRRLQARSWLTRPMRERQGHEQWLHGNVMSGVVVEVAWACLLCLLSLSEFILTASNWAAAWWIVWHQTTQSAARLDHCLSGGERLRQAVLESLLWSPSLTMASGEFTVHDDLRKAMVFHFGKLQLGK